MSHKLNWVGTACAMACSLTLILRMGASADADVIVGAPGNAAQLFPFVFYNGGITGEYQQAYAAADFSAHNDHWAIFLRRPPNRHCYYPGHLYYQSSVQREPRWLTFDDVRQQHWS
jgi:hypothetical protein